MPPQSFPRGKQDRVRSLISVPYVGAVAGWYGYLANINRTTSDAYATLASSLYIQEKGVMVSNEPVVIGGDLVIFPPTILFL